jgi:amino acid transporter
MLGLWDVTTITAGTILGSAIFVAAAFVPREVPHPALAMLLWVVGGLIVIAGALTYAELLVGARDRIGSARRLDLAADYGAGRGVLGYPWVPALFLVAMSGLVLNTLRERPARSLLGVGIVALGVPFFRWRRRRTQTRVSEAW